MSTSDRQASSAASLRRWLVVRLIRWADRGWTASFSAYNRAGAGSRWHRFWSWLACRIDHAALGLARRLDRDNRWMGAEMAECGWWG